MYGIGMYKKANVTTADPLKLVLMCYEGAISNTKIAREKLISNEHEAKAKAIQKVQDILSTLIQSLDFEKGGSIAVNLNSLYVYMIRRITEGDLKKDAGAFDEVTAMLEELESGWRGISMPSNEDRRVTEQNGGDERAGMAAGAY
jgi:flagellar protein FliS